jgi:hypothetical protein
LKQPTRRLKDQKTMRIDKMQTNEFYQLKLNQPNFEGPNGTWGGWFKGGRYKFENKPSYWKTDYAQLRPVEWINEVGPTPPRLPDWLCYDEPTSVSDSGATTAMLLGTVLVVLAVWRKFSATSVASAPVAPNGRSPKSRINN